MTSAGGLNRLEEAGLPGGWNKLVVGGREETEVGGLVGVLSNTFWPTVVSFFILLFGGTNSGSKVSKLTESSAFLFLSVGGFNFHLSC